MRIVDNAIALRIVYLLTVPFEKTKAFKLGLIDKNGKNLKKAQTSEEKSATSMLHRLVWNLKRMINMVPGGKTRIGSLAAAYFLIREAYQQELDSERASEFYADSLVMDNFEQYLDPDNMSALEYELTSMVEDVNFGSIANNTGNVAVPKLPMKLREIEVSDKTFKYFADGKRRSVRNMIRMFGEVDQSVIDVVAKNQEGAFTIRNAATGEVKIIQFGNRTDESTECIGYDAY